MLRENIPRIRAEWRVESREPYPFLLAEGVGEDDDRRELLMEDEDDEGVGGVDDEETLERSCDEDDGSNSEEEDNGDGTGFRDASQLLLLTNGNTLTLLDPRKPDKLKTRNLSWNTSIYQREIYPFFQVLLFPQIPLPLWLLRLHE